MEILRPLAARAAPAALASLASLAILVSGCSDSGGPGCGDGGAGELDVAIIGLPLGARGSVALSQDGTPVVTASTSGAITLPGGRYAVAAGAVAPPDESFVRSLYTARPVDEVCVRDGGRAILAVAYTREATSGRLWSSTSSGLADLDGSVLTADGSSTPRYVNAYGRSIAFDREGNVWATDPSSGQSRVMRFPASAIAASAVTGVALVPDVEITGLQGAFDLSFDPAGNLWVADSNANEIVRYDAATLLSPAPAKALTIVTTDIQPFGLAFDLAGNLYAGTFTGVSRYDAARLTTGTDNGPPDALIQSNASSGFPLGEAGGLAFAEDGALWVAFVGYAIIGRHDASLIAGTGTYTVTPNVQLLMNNSETQLGGIAFDEQGGLWTPYLRGKIGRFSPTELLVTGGSTPGNFDQVPSLVLDASATTTQFQTPAFHPAPAFTNLYNAYVE